MNTVEPSAARAKRQQRVQVRQHVHMQQRLSQLSASAADALECHIKFPIPINIPCDAAFRQKFVDQLSLLLLVLLLLMINGQSNLT